MAKTEFVKAFQKVRKIVHELDTAMSELQYEMEQQLLRAVQKKAKSAAAGGK
jgi:hypothetical protein